MTTNLKFATAAKMYAALIGSVVTALLGVVAPDSPGGKVLLIVSVVATAVATWAVPNAGGVEDGEGL